MRPRLFRLLAAIAFLAAACLPHPAPAGPQPLELKWPAEGEAVDASPILQWGSFPGATHYQVTVTDGGSSAVILEQDTTEPMLAVAPPLSKGAAYAWNVQAQDADHAVLAELDGRFTVKAELALVWPPAGEAVDGAPALQWEAFPGAVQYHVTIVDDLAYPPVVVLDQVVGETVLPVVPPLDAGSYSWIVRASDARGAVLAELNSTFTVPAPAQAFDCGASPARVDFQGIGFACASALGTSVRPEVMPAIPAAEGGPFWEAQPEHVRFTLADAPGAAGHAPMGATLSAEAQILVYPVADYAALSPAIRERIDALQALLAAPRTIEDEAPLLPLTNAAQVLHAQVKYLDFQNGSGVRYLTQYAQGVGPVNNQELFYTFQGLTADGACYVAAFFPAAAPALPASPEMSAEDFAALAAGFDAYLAETTALLDGQAPGAFTPDLAQIDRLIESLAVNPR